MTECSKCNGRGTVGYFHIDHFVDIECDRCHGSGEVEMTNEEWLKSLTNEEWLKSLSTEELANYIATQCADAVRLWREMQYWTANEKCKSNKWYVWLKEKHK